MATHSTDPFLSLDTMMERALTYHLSPACTQATTHSEIVTGADEVARNLLVAAADAQVGLWSLSDKLLAERSRQQ